MQKCLFFNCLTCAVLLLQGTTALAYSSAGAHPLAVSPSDFSEMYEDNKDLWGDMDAQSAHLNYQRSMSGNVDSARLLMEVS